MLHEIPLAWQRVISPFSVLAPDVFISITGTKQTQACLQQYSAEQSTMKWKHLWDCQILFLFMSNTTRSWYFCVSPAELETSQRYKISNITKQAAKDAYTGIFCNYESYKHCVNITNPLRAADCLCFRASSHSLPCHKYCLSLVHSSASAAAFEYFRRLLGLHRCFHSGGLITGDPGPAVSRAAERREPPADREKTLSDVGQ